MRLLPLKPTLAENAAFAANPDCQPSLEMSIQYFEKIGYQPPWIGYFAEEGGKMVGNAAFKGAPKAGRVEIAYATFAAHQNQGIGTRICAALVALAQANDPNLILTARTLPESNFSTRILEKNGFQLVGSVQDPEDGEVWEWEWRGGI